MQATGGDPMTSKQEVELHDAYTTTPISTDGLIIQGFIQSLAEQKGVDVDTASLDKGSASKKINELKSMEASSEKGDTTSDTNKQGEAIGQDAKDWTTGQESATQKQRGYSE
jgi:hypothetical protein